MTETVLYRLRTYYPHHPVCIDAANEIEMLNDLLKTAKDLIEVVRMPNQEHVADAHNSAVQVLRNASKFNDA
jgi:hypothetical protein